LKIIVHDYGGYPFTRQLAESLVKRKHWVNYIYSETTQSIKRGAHLPGQSDLQVTPVVLTKKFAKYSLFQRRAAEIEHGKKMAYEIKQFHPEVVFSADTPLDAQKFIVSACERRKTRFVFWLQDAIGLATRQVLSRKIPLAGSLIGRYYELLERRLVKHSDGVVLISEDFLPLMKRWNIPQSQTRVIHNWAPLDELPVQPKANPWAFRMGLADKFCFLYSGILGYKHTPDLFVQLAREFRAQQDVRVVVIAEGEKAQWLKQEKENQQLENLVLLPYQAVEEFPQVLGAGDVLISILNTEAGSYSVPSKVYSYLCSQRPLLLSVPPENLAARISNENQVGLISSPIESGKWISNARSLYADQNQREKMGDNARRFAERNFNIDQITDRFEEIMESCWKN
jgi:colanic acid biosynthesis glycosyl transferase WcaI